jgi:hypothetical protein
LFLSKFGKNLNKRMQQIKMKKLLYHEELKDRKKGFGLLFFMSFMTFMVKEIDKTLLL